MSDSISRADVVRLLVERYKFTTEEATEILSTLPSAESEWIPCSERLPSETNGTVLATVDYGGKIEVRTARHSEHSEMWYIGDMCAVSTNTNILAWKPLPIPYREDGEV